MRYFTSDLHLGDKGIARWRDFQSVRAHDELIVAGLQRLAPDDELWILGDVCKPNVAAARELREVIPCGRVHIVVGNHDTGAKFLTCGGYATVDYYAQVGKVAVEGYKFVMSHYPMLDWDRAFHGSYMLHGHIHSLPVEGAGEGLFGEGVARGMFREGGTEVVPVEGSAEAVPIRGTVQDLPAEGAAKDLPAPRDRASGGFGLRGYNDWNRSHGIRRFDVGVDANGYRPVSAEQIVAFFPSDDEWRMMHGLGE